MNVITDTYINLLSDWVIIIITCAFTYWMLFDLCDDHDNNDDDEHGWSW